MKNICFVINNNYYDKMIVTLNSLIINDKDYYKVFILNNDLIDEQFVSLRKLFENKIEFIDCKVSNEKFKDVTMMRNDHNMTAYFKLFIPEVIHNCERVLYLDCDIIINSNIDELYNIDFSNKSLAAVPDEMINKYELTYKKSIGMNDNDIYFNSGVVLFNLHKMKESYNINKVFLYMATHKDLRFHDQEILNVFFIKDYLKLDRIYNVMTSYTGIFDFIKYFFIRKVKKEYKIIHYCNLKPWNDNYVGKYKRLYYKQYKKVRIKLSNDFYEKNNIFKIIKMFFIKIKLYFKKRRSV